MLLHAIESLSEVPGPVHLAIGVFDGVHLGHQAVIRQAVRSAAVDKGTAVVVTFDPHPVKVLRPESAPRLLTSTSHKIAILTSFGIEEILLVKFDREFAATPPGVFVERLASACRPLRTISVGQQWAFGKGRAGNLELLAQYGAKLNFEVLGVPDVEVNQTPVSSTNIRAAVQEGRLDDAAAFLGRPFSILGTVEHGQHLGQQLGFPTANLSAHNEQFPPNGVYAVRARLDHKLYGGVVNIGTRPTIDASATNRVLELHLFDFHRDIYGTDVEVEFAGRLRAEQRFAGLEELRQQITRDVEQARAILK